jgi:uncharacterized protein with GYD domain
MAKYLVVASYSADGIAGVLKGGGTARVKAVEKMVGELGGTVESFYFAFGGDDVYVTVELPDNIAAAALGMTVGASKAVTVRTIVLLSPADIDKAAKTNVLYTPPGS